MNTERIVGISLGLIVLFIGFVIYQTAVAIPRERIEAQQEQAQREREQAVRDQIERERKYDSCIATAYADYSVSWDSNCESRGFEKDCSLPGALATNLNNTHEQAQQRCVDLYRAQ